MSRFLPHLIAVVLLATSIGEASAKIDPAKFDTQPEDMKLSPSETQRFMAELDRILTQEIDSAARREALHYETQISNWRSAYPENPSIPLTHFKSYEPNTCADHGLYLRDDVQTATTIGCTSLFAASGANLSFTQDHQADTTALQVQGGVAIRLWQMPDVGANTNRSQTGPVLGDAALSLFLQADGTFNDRDNASADDEGYARLGLKGDFAVADVFGNEDELAIVTSAYYQSDFSKNNHGYGAQISATPQILNWRLNTAPEVNLTTEAVKRYHFFTAAGTIDGFRLEKRKDTKLLKEKDYLWVGGRAGFTAFTSEIIPKGIKFFATVDAFRNFAQRKGDRDDAMLYTAGLDFYLDSKKTTAFSLSYEKGEKRQEPDKKKEEFKIGFKIKF